MLELIKEEIEKYTYNHTSPAPELLQILEKETRETMEHPDCLIERVEGRFLKMIVQLFNPKLILELGTYTGYSALSMAEGLQDDGELITCEINTIVQQVAQKAFDKSSHGHKIKLHMGPAVETIKKIDRKIDMSFIDADKVNYINYYEEIVKRTRKGGLIIIDNVLWKGEVLEPKDEEGKIIADLNTLIKNDKRVENVFLTIRDGIQFVRKI
ncbi:MAG TPA: class I SAM-dependent methyltransferase [Victivallales bacterium]|nr:class I SAM-dependent methyltransferase [Victivallales bacterium]